MFVGVFVVDLFPSVMTKSGLSIFVFCHLVTECRDKSLHNVRFWTFTSVVFSNFMDKIDVMILMLRLIVFF